MVCAQGKTSTGLWCRLQDHVPETVKAVLAGGGIRVWMLSDKMETVINICALCVAVSHYVY